MKELEISRTPELIGAEIRTLTRQAQSITLYFGIEIGRRLSEAKELCAHGEWLDFLKKETEFSQPTASRFMRLFSEYGEAQGSLFGAEAKDSTLNTLSVSNALRLLALPEDEREDFAVAHDVEHLSTAKVEEMVKARVAELEAEKQKQALALASAESRNKILEDELSASGEELKKARGLITELQTRPIEVVVERDEEAISAAVKEAQSAADKIIKDREKELKAARAEKNKAQKEAEQLRRDMAQLDKAPAAPETVEKLKAQFEEQIKDAEARAAAAEKQLKLASPEAAVFKVHFDEAQKQLKACAAAIVTLHEKDTETADKLTAALMALLEHYRKMLIT